jgi:hypothetical protein
VHTVSLWLSLNSGYVFPQIRMRRTSFFDMLPKRSVGLYLQRGDDPRRDCKTCSPLHVCTVAGLLVHIRIAELLEQVKGVTDLLHPLSITSSVVLGDSTPCVVTPTAEYFSYSLEFFSLSSVLPRALDNLCRRDSNRLFCWSRGNRYLVTTRTRPTKRVECLKHSLANQRRIRLLPIP